MAENWTIKRVLDWATDDFSKRGMESPRLEAEVLLRHVLKVDRLTLYTHFDQPLSVTELSEFRAVIGRRRSGECAAYITGRREFWSLSFEVTRDVLVPRADTETIMDVALPLIKDGTRVLDLCCGSGCIGVAIAKERPGACVHAADVSAPALEVARRNALAHSVADHVSFFEGDLFSALPVGETYDVIATNPPYVINAEIDGLSIEVRGEPRIALDGGGADGLDIIRRILEAAPLRLNRGGHLLIELDPRQAAVVAGELGPAQLGVVGEIINDLAGRPRVVHFAIRSEE